MLWNGVDRIEFRTAVDDYADHDRLFRVRFPAAIAGGRPVSEVGNAVIGRPFGTPNVDVAKVPFTLDNPAYNWFGLGSTARIDLTASEGRDGGSAPTARASRAFGVAEIVVPDDPELDDVTRRLVVGLVRIAYERTVVAPD